jgi:hypothetical protein
LAESVEEDAQHQRAANRHHHQHHDIIQPQNISSDNLPSIVTSAPGLASIPRDQLQHQPLSNVNGGGDHPRSSATGNDVNTGTVSSHDVLATTPHGQTGGSGIGRSDTPPPNNSVDTPLLTNGNADRLRSSSGDIGNNITRPPALQLHHIDQSTRHMELPGTPSEAALTATSTITPSNLTLVGSTAGVMSRVGSTMVNNSPVAAASSHARVVTSMTPGSPAARYAPTYRAVTSIETSGVSSHDVVSHGETLLLPTRTAPGGATGSHGNASLTDSQITLEIILAHPVTVEIFKDRLASIHSSEILQFYLEVTSFHRSILENLFIG